MNCLVTAGPTFEPIDRVRRLTNFSTGRLGTELAVYLHQHGHAVTLLRSAQATWHAGLEGVRVIEFTTTTDLRTRLEQCAGPAFEAVFHAAAVSDFTPGPVWLRTTAGDLVELAAGKLPSQEGPLLLELRPTPKLLGALRQWFPGARIMGWKYEVDGGREEVVAKAEAQLRQHQTQACVANGPAYGDGFGLVTGSGRCLHLSDRAALFTELERWLRDQQ